jgi:hypothetical protein
VNKGADRYLEFLQQLDGTEYMQRFEAMLEYFKPKLARTELTGKGGKDLLPTPILTPLNEDKQTQLKGANN